MKNNDTYYKMMIMMVMMIIIMMVFGTEKDKDGDDYDGSGYYGDDDN